MAYKGATYIELDAEEILKLLRQELVEITYETHERDLDGQSRPTKGKVFLRERRKVGGE